MRVDISFGREAILSDLAASLDMNGWLLLVLAASTAASRVGPPPPAPNANLEKENVILKSFVSLIRSKLYELDENLLKIGL